MKFFTGRQLLNHATSAPLVEIDLEEVERTLSENVKQRVSNSRGCCTTPTIFRKPASPQRFCQTPFVNRHRLINLSFSQPSSPSTPCVGSKKKVVCATPFVKIDRNQERSTESFVPPTPMIVNSIETLNCPVANIDVLGTIPDILEIIDDETHQIDTIDRQLKLLSDTELNDDSVVEYLLDLSQEVKQKQTHHTKPQDNHPERGRVRKKSRYTKLMSEEERETLRHIQKEKSKQKRKQRFREPPVSGTRRSKRIRQPVRSYRS